MKRRCGCSQLTLDTCLFYCGTLGWAEHGRSFADGCSDEGEALSALKENVVIVDEDLEDGELPDDGQEDTDVLENDEEMTPGKTADEKRDTGAATVDPPSAPASAIPSLLHMRISPPPNG